MTPEREDYADPPGGPSVLIGLAWLAGLFLTLVLLAFLITLTCALGFGD